MMLLLLFVTTTSTTTHNRERERERERERDAHDTHVTQREDGAWNRERDTYGTQIETHGSLGREVARRSYNNLHVNNNFLDPTMICM